MSTSLYANQIWGGRFVVSADEFVGMKDNTIIIIDARVAKKHKKGHPIHAISMQWNMFTKSADADRGELLAFDTIAKKLSEKGVSSDRPIVVFDDAKSGWGESGRIAWMLHELGHDDVAIIDGGIQALKKAGYPMEKKIRKKEAASFTLRKTQTWAMSIDQVANAAETKTAVIDTREKREYKGWTPYGESRGGHVPGAQHVFYRDLVDKKGVLKKKDEIIHILASRGIKKTTRIVAYCTGGIRSAWMVVVLRHLGYESYNYAGSMWQWSSRDEKKFPLVKNLNPFSD